MKRGVLSCVVVVVSALFHASSARAQAQAPDVVAEAPSARFGKPGSAVVDIGGITVQRYTSPLMGGTSGSVSGQLTLSAFVVPGWSIGASLGAAFSRTFGGLTTTTTTAAVEVRGGHLTPIAPHLSLWPQLGFGYAWTTVDRSGSSTIGTDNESTLMADLDFPLLLHASRSFYVAAGPGITARLTSYRQYVAAYVRLSFGCSFDLASG